MEEVNQTELELEVESKWLSRKFLLAIITLVLTSILVYNGSIDAGVYSAVVIANLAGYFTANVMQKKS